jgi:membrane protease YdiL (CAAX protease family)
MEYQTEIEDAPKPRPEPDAKGARRAASFCAFATILVIAISYAIVIGVSFLLKNVEINELAIGNLNMIVSSISIDLIAMPLAWLILLRRVKRNPEPEIGTVTPLSMRILLFLFPCAMALMIAGSLTGKLVGMLFGEGLSDVVSGMVESIDPWMTLICVVIIAPIMEELFFRKAMIDRLSAFHPTDAILFSALLFGLVHGNLTQFLYAFPLGILLGIIYYRTQNIRYTILLHVAVNTLGGLVPQLVTMLTGSMNETAATIVMAVYSQLILALAVLGLIFLIIRRKNFLPVPSRIPRFRRPFYVNVGFIIASIVFTALFVLNEIAA